MIRYALQCDDSHQFEAWFSTSDDYDMQVERGLVECPVCGSLEITKQIMAPNVSTSRKKDMMAGGGPDIAPDLKQIASKVQAHIRNNFDYVGNDFASEATAIHNGEKPERLIYGETTPDETKKLKEDGVPCTPLPDAFAPVPPKKTN